jgi:hypothetical protein
MPPTMRWFCVLHSVATRGIRLVSCCSKRSRLIVEGAWGKEVDVDEVLVLQQRFSLLSFLVIWTYICGHPWSS